MIVDPHFQAADVFAQFHLGPLPALASGDRAWTLGNRAVVAPGEIYAQPSSETRAAGEVLCEIKVARTNDTVAWVIDPVRTASVAP